jgi:pilus assembly protein CpaB
MRKTTAVLIAGTFLLGVLVICIASFSLRRAKLQDRSVRPIVVAAVPLAFGERITSGNLKLMWTGAEPPSAYLSVETAVGDGRRSARQAIRVNQALLPSLTAEEAPRLGNDGAITRTMRAVAVPLSVSSSLKGLLRPGDRVDVLLTQVGRIDRQPFTDLVLQDVRVLAVGINTSFSSLAPNFQPTITLEVTPLNAAKIVLAQEVGRVDFALRGVSDEEPIALPTVRVQDLTIGSSTTGSVRQ